MKNKATLLIALIIVIFIASGCYTQLGTVREYKDEYQEEYTYQKQKYESDTLYDDENNVIINNYYFDGYWYPRYRWMFSYYYPSYYWPSFAFGFAYYDPWFYDWYWNRYWYYDPFYWCYTPWMSYPIYYPPYYWRYPWYYVSRDGDIISKRRDFGNQRESGRSDYMERIDDRFGTGRSGIEIPGATGIIGGGRSQGSSTDQVRGRSRSTETSPTVTPRTGERTGRSKTDSQRPPSRRERYEQPSRDRDNDNSRSSGSERERRTDSRESTRIYSPPAPSPQPSSPPPSSPAPSRGGDSRGGSNNDNNNSRGGNTRGGR